MKKKLVTAAGFLMLLIACSSTQNAGETTGSILRAPVDFFSGLGRGITGQGHMPLRQFSQDWDNGEMDPDFWESDETFFADL